MDDDVFALAVKRGKRTAVPRDWVDRVRSTEGVTIMGDANATRLQIRATSDGIDAIERELAEYLYIERLIRHDRS